MVDPVRFALFLLWGVGSSIVWLGVFHKSWVSWVTHRDRRSKREVLRDASLVVTAIGSTFFVLAVLFGEQGGTPRSIALAAALGAFLAAGIVALTLRKSEEKGEEP